MKCLTHIARLSAPPLTAVPWRIWRRGNPAKTVVVRAQLFFEACKLAETRLPGESALQGRMEPEVRP